MVRVMIAIFHVCAINVEQKDLYHEFITVHYFHYVKYTTLEYNAKEILNWSRHSPWTPVLAQRTSLSRTGGGSMSFRSVILT